MPKKALKKTKMKLTKKLMKTMMMKKMMMKNKMTMNKWMKNTIIPLIELLMVINLFIPKIENLYLKKKIQISFQNNNKKNSKNISQMALKCPKKTKNFITTICPQIISFQMPFLLQTKLVEPN